MNVDPKKIINERIITNLKNDEQIQQNGIDLTVAEQIVLEPKSFINVLLNEKIKIPLGIMGLFNIRSSFSRKGIFTTSGVWDTGYEGVIGCSIYNMSDDKVTIPKDERIGQMIFFTSMSNKKYDGFYKNNEEIRSKLK